MLIRTLSLSVLFVLGLASCSDDNNNNNNNNVASGEYSFEVMATNLTYSQPLSPLSVVAHTDGTLWSIGTEASASLELLAEGGDTSGIESESFVVSHVSGQAAIGPGSSDTLTLDIQGVLPEYLSMATMLVNTNDAFTGLSQLSTSIALGETVTYNLSAYDAGTEANSEAQGTMPGPADQGEGFNAVRDDISNHVRLHAGVVTVADGLSTSVLTEAHRFDNPVMKVTVTRTK